ncbi:MAG TPA: hypothetical protein VI874_02970 [Candidatus Norongarragalinales archaeon]|nr:hypothetical protein [Candidatus Norongarragalinales archaeon]
MSLSKYIRKSFATAAGERNVAFTHRLRAWRKEPVVMRAVNPTNPLRARSLGYKASKGYVVARVRVKRGKRRRNQPDQGRKPGRNRKRVNPGQTLMNIAKDKARRRFVNLKPLNAYWVGQDGVYKYFEVILKDPFYK